MSVHRIWQAFGLQPHRTKSFTRSPDPLLIDKVRDSVGVYLNPPQHAAVFCVDDKPQIQAWDRTAPVLPLRPGHAERRPHDDNRHGTTSLFAALAVTTGHGRGQIRRRHRAIACRAFLTALDVQVPADRDVHVIMDNDGTHKTALLRRWFARPRACIRTARRRTPRGSIASSTGLPPSRGSNCVEACMTASARLSPRFANASTPPTRRASQTCGRTPPTTFWLASPASPYARSRSTTASR